MLQVRMSLTAAQPELRLVSDRVRSFEWARKEPKPARERLGPLKSRKLVGKR